jgi:hypothetical protein
MKLIDKSAPYLVASLIYLETVNRKNGNRKSYGKDLFCKREEYLANNFVSFFLWVIFL